LLSKKYKKTSTVVKADVMQSGKLIIGLGGDVMIGRNVDAVMNGMGYRFVWGNLITNLLQTDLNIVNLETTLTHSKQKVPKVFNFKASPDKVVALTDANIQVVNLANNHILDFTETGLLDTLKTLEAAGIRYVGAGRTGEEAARPACFTRNGISLGIVGFTDNEPGWKATVSKPGVNHINITNPRDREKALLCIGQTKKVADIVIVSIHWGPNMKVEPSPAFIDFAHQMIDSGATIIHGHSAHNFQGIELYKGKLILYDTGDLVDDYVVHPTFKNDHSFFFRVDVNKEGVTGVHLTPVLIDNCQVNLATGKDSRWSLQRMRELSQPWGTTITESGEVLLEDQPEKIRNE
jgi:poly-gamma-glutamate capsule biosynthesis protein CapA/YwtB (metallophosphatase superfamily)